MSFLIYKLIFQEYFCISRTWLSLHHTTMNSGKHFFFFFPKRKWNKAKQNGYFQVEGISFPVSWSLSSVTEGNSSFKVKLKGGKGKEEHQKNSCIKTKTIFQGLPTLLPVSMSRTVTDKTEVKHHMCSPSLLFLPLISEIQDIRLTLRGNSCLFIQRVKYWNHFCMLLISLHTMI